MQAKASNKDMIQLIYESYLKSEEKLAQTEEEGRDMEGLTLIRQRH